MAAWSRFWKRSSVRLSTYQRMHQPWVGYSFAVGVTLLATLARLLVPQVLAGTPYLAFYPAVVAAAGLYGRGPGVLATIGSLLCVDLVFDRTPLWIEFSDPVVLGRAAIFLAGGIGISIVAGRQRAAQDRLSQQAEQLRESQQRLALAASGARVGMFDWNTITNERHWTPEHEIIFGYPPAAATTIHSYQDWADRVHPDDLPWVVEKSQQSLVEGKPYVVQYRIVWPDGSVHWIEARGQPMYDQEGCSMRMMGTVMDITDRKHAEEELTAAKQSAERAKAVAEQANRAKDHFLAVLSHELRTPLTPVVMGVSMLQDRSDLDPQVRETLEMVRRNVEMEVRLIDDLLDVTRIVRGKIELNRRHVELCTVIQGAVEVCKPDIEARGLHFGVDIGPASPYWVEADVARLQQVFWNLLKNAVKFTPHGGCVGIRCRPNGKYVIAEVNDSGIGMEPEALTRVFNAFEQAERSITRQFGGLGLGLAISKALVELHGGEIEAYSEGRDKGSTFRIRLPLTAPAGRPEAPEPAAPAQRVVRPLRILLVEDHGVTAKMMQMVLVSEGHTVENAGDVTTGLELAGQHPFDLLLSDLGLPDGSGHDLMRELRVRGYRFPGIALSGYGQEEDIRRSYEAGFVAHLTKPASREAVLEAVARVTATLSAEPEVELHSVPQAECQAAVQTEAPVFDAAVALERCGDAEMLQEMIDCFYDEVDLLFPEMRAALEKGDLVEVGRLGHRMKGTVVYLGAEPAKEAALRTEHFEWNSGEPAEAEAAVNAIERECQALKAALVKYQAS